MSMRSARRGRSPRAILAAGLLALAVAPLASHAAEVSPVLEDASVKSGWSRFSNRVSAKYNRLIDPATSTASMKDDLNVDVPGATSVESGKTLVFTPTTALSERQAYTVTFTAWALAAGIPVGDTPGKLESTFAFKVDLKRPDNPSILTPGFGEIVGDTGTVTGSSRDKDFGEPDFDRFATSGISAIELHFYELRAPGMPRTPAINPSDATATMNNIGNYLTPGNLGSVAEGWVGSMSREVLSYRTKVTLCTTACGQTLAWSASMPSLPKGVWAVKAVAIDLAGNVSGESSGVTFIRG